MIVKSRLFTYPMIHLNVVAEFELGPWWMHASIVRGSVLEMADAPDAKGQFVGPHHTLSLVDVGRITKFFNQCSPARLIASLALQPM